MSWDDGAPEQGLLFSPALEELLGPRRRKDDELEPRHKDLAASMQRVYEERFFALVRRALAETKTKRLVLAGGCASELARQRAPVRPHRRRGGLDPARGGRRRDLARGGALGRARRARPAARRLGHGARLLGAGVRRGRGPQGRRRGGPGLGRPGRPARRGLDRHRGDDEVLCRETAEAIAAGEVVGWYQGRSEWGPRALGNRSILADPRRADMKDVLNLKIKRRESFRPFAPSILEERTGEWFTIDHPDPFMLKVYPIRPEKRAAIPAVVHVDGTGRLQTVSERSNPLYAKLIRSFEQVTGVPIVLNTSFNENEPIVNTPAEALDCFLRTKMDRLAMGRVVLRRIRARGRGVTRCRPVSSSSRPIRPTTWRPTCAR